MDKKSCEYIYAMKYFLAIKNKEILPYAIDWMDLDSIMLSKISQSIERKVPYDPTNKIN